ncbi:hypothetical protein I316_04789 [Kwoniella heveanensis BCC8398]|uniref:2'-phosphotransferase n=1 Tax=Kwoniella heveanensis BCC8398 TaxID=1296120 RepID=A0A1B9GQM0_9TREE|nr:hypothetical protein I316_04789 [Kwoniella heveanensis BCC8398]
MPRPPETPDVRASKALAYILRHGAEKEGLHIRSDGYIKLAAVLARPKMREIDLETVLRLVSENAKQRFQLMYGYDPSPLPPKKKKVQQISKKKLRAMEDAQAQAQAQVEAHTSVEERGNAAGSSSVHVSVDGGVDQAQQAARTGPKASLDPHLEAQPQPESTELPLVELPLPNPHGEDESSSDPSSSTSTASTAAAAVAGGIKGEYFIRATQGHSINLESTAHLEQITAEDEAARKKVGLMVHGTRWELYETLKSQGLSRMTRQHVHLAPSFQGAIVPRPNSTLYIYLSLPKLLEAGIPVYVSHNGVVLTPGNEEGIVHREFWAKAVRKQSGKRLVVWEEGKEVEREMTEDEE